jgi:hypothetical protein
VSAYAAQEPSAWLACISTIAHSTAHSTAYIAVLTGSLSRAVQSLCTHPHHLRHPRPTPAACWDRKSQRCWQRLGPKQPYAHRACCLLPTCMLHRTGSHCLTSAPSAGVITSGEVTHQQLSQRPDSFWQGLGTRCLHITWGSRGAISLEGLGLQVGLAADWGQCSSAALLECPLMPVMCHSARCLAACCCSAASTRH